MHYAQQKDFWVATTRSPRQQNFIDLKQWRYLSFHFNMGANLSIVRSPFLRHYSK